MPRSSRSKPGCHECSRRRIKCDLGSPSCVKCLKKGLQCSGQTKYRFNVGVANRGNLKGYEFPAAQAQLGNVKSLQWEPTRLVTAETGIVGSPAASQESEEIEEIEVVRRSESSMSLHRAIDVLPAGVSFLFSHFSAVICPHMVIFDNSNGWRDIILPLAVNDDLIQRAVCVVAAQHVTLRRNIEGQDRIEEQRLKVLHQLIENADDRNMTDRMVSIWATLLVLLIGETVTGGSDFRHLHRSLQAFQMAANPKSSERPLLRFMEQQTQLFTTLAQPTNAIALRDGQQAQSFEQLFGFLGTQTVNDDEEAQKLGSIRAAMRMAYMLYHASFNGDITASIDLIGELVDICLAIPPGSQGEHALVWAYFMGAAESRSAENREFFVSRMIGIHDRTGFGNISASIDNLKRVWELSPDRSWAYVLPEICQVLIM